VDSYRKGYPQFSFIIGETPEFQNFRRFRRVRARLMLVKQDRIVEMEKRLDDIDRDEKAELFLGNVRRDRNDERAVVLRNLDEALADYGINIFNARSII
jgi:hypothetical protein